MYSFTKSNNFRYTKFDDISFDKALKNIEISFNITQYAIDIIGNKNLTSSQLDKLFHFVMKHKELKYNEYSIVVLFVQNYKHKCKSKYIEQIVNCEDINIRIKCCYYLINRKLSKKWVNIITDILYEYHHDITHFIGVFSKSANLINSKYINLALEPDAINDRIIKSLVWSQPINIEQTKICLKHNPEIVLSAYTKNKKLPKETLEYLSKLALIT